MKKYSLRKKNYIKYKFFDRYYLFIIIGLSIRFK